MKGCSALDRENLLGYFGVALLTPYWVTHEGLSIRLAFMSTDHIRAAMEYIKKGDGRHGPVLRRGCSGFTNCEWMLMMAAELARRARLM